MQYAKDSFYMTLMERMVALNPLQTITLNGATRPAIIVAENELVIPVEPLPDAFYVEWSAAQPAQPHASDPLLMAMECVISYHTFGSVQSGVDRGRALASLDMELLAMCTPSFATKRDYTQVPSLDLGTNIFWSEPSFGKVAGSEAPKPEGLPRGSSGVRLERSANLTVFFYPEAILP